ncbi:MAG: enoyl-CoA hydratase [Acidimicrobiia bacterium]|nr:enoyl-CoA hydratase [Acidimicrobiia bacterium]
MKITAETVGGVATLTLADPDNRNALSGALLAELLAAIDEAENDEAVRAIVVTNEGHIFSAGADLKESATGESYTARMAEVFSRIVHSPKPFVGRIRGHAVAGGVGLACAMDISIAIDDAKFGFTEVRVGVAPAIISTICLPKMRRADAAAAFLRGNRFLAPEAARLGLINESVPVDRLDERIDETVGDLLLGAPKALAATKSLLTRIPAMPFDDAVSWASELSGRLFGSEEAKEGMTAYLEKRRPEWAPEA